MIFFNSDNDGGHALWDVALHPFNEKSRQEKQLRKIRLATLDGIIMGQAPRRPKLIKIDTEGAELSVLRGTARSLSSLQIPYVICEINRFGLNQMGSPDVDIPWFPSPSLGTHCPERPVSNKNRNHSVESRLEAAPTMEDGQKTELYMENLKISPHIGNEAKIYIRDLAQLRITVFREFPYLYDGTLEYEEKYLKAYTDSPESIVVIAFDGDRVVGASTGIPMENADPGFQKPFIDKGFDPRRIFYFGESVLLKEYRGKGHYVFFFKERENYAKRLGRFDWVTFCAVVRPDHHPRKPEGYKSLDGYWEKQGFTKRDDLICHFPWQEIDEIAETPKPMVFWIKSLKKGAP